jgi:Tfp pilus assembly protein PilN
MAVPLLPLNLAPRPSLWRQRHQLIGWAALGVGILFMVGAVGFTWRAYHQADRAGRDAVSLTEEAKRLARQEQQLQASLQDMDAGREQSRWKLAERILQERSLPWSRLTAELEQCMVPDMRLKGLQRARSNAQQVVLKLKGEARTRQAEAAFVESLRATPVFAQVILERESERIGGGWDFEISLPTAAVPPPFQVKAIQRGPVASAAPTRVSSATTVRIPVPSPATPVRPSAPQTRPMVVPPPPPAPSADELPVIKRRRPARARAGDGRDPE